jgi:O-succinylhomoserine sulfhydrylase
VFFGATHSLFVNYFPKWNIETTYFDINNPDIIESCIKPNTKILLPNHLLTQRLILDLELLGAIAKKQFDSNN